MISDIEWWIRILAIVGFFAILYHVCLGVAILMDNLHYYNVHWHIW